jgi:hypothetical protein
MVIRIPPRPRDDPEIDGSDDADDKEGGEIRRSPGDGQNAQLRGHWAFNQNPDPAEIRHRYSPERLGHRPDFA